LSFNKPFVSVVGNYSHSLSEDKVFGQRPRKLRTSGGAAPQSVPFLYTERVEQSETR